jgi:hypothetical protein
VLSDSETFPFPDVKRMLKQLAVNLNDSILLLSHSYAQKMALL